MDAAVETSALTAPVDADLLAILNERASDSDQRIFFESFAAYLTVDRNAFVIDLDDVIGVLGYTRRDNARRSVENALRLNVDYTLLLTTEEQKSVAAQAHADGRGGHNRERIMLTVRGFKELCIMAGTEHGKRMRHYYMTMEEVYFEYLRRKMEAVAIANVAANERIAIADAAADEQKAIAEAAKAAAEEQKAIAEAAKAELARHRNKTYEEVQGRTSTSSAMCWSRRWQATCWLWATAGSTTATKRKPSASRSLTARAILSATPLAAGATPTCA